METTVASVQGAYFLTTGLWPIFSIRTFMMITGPKTDLWLVKTVGAVLGVTGAALLVAGLADQVTQALVLLAVGSAAALAAADVIYASRKVIAPVYLLDAVLEAALIVWWVAALLL
ncbi:hypothetical protein [Geomonas paludis]|uniref:Uncharacterized protein n=1 Tax=Geomonas paludis TaxID=2740185 RepID=A0A6V8N067_9BACT|nr:hypothetical protein [Geomonas paludis]GFO65730.1 hypothetical protein GMPD_36490 [Geomonas paludis]